MSEAETPRNVLDASVALKWVLKEDHSSKALALRDEFQRGFRELIAPDIFPVEVAHVLSKAVRQNKLKAAEAELHLANIWTTLPQLVSSLDLMERAFEISCDTRTSLYDALYLALAELEGPLITADAKVAKLKFPVVELHAL
jgi:predicted nucleic acid-binding protein